MTVLSLGFFGFIPPTVGVNDLRPDSISNTPIRISVSKIKGSADLETMSSIRGNVDCGLNFQSSLVEGFRILLPSCGGAHATIHPVLRLRWAWGVAQGFLSGSSDASHLLIETEANEVVAFRSFAINP